MRTVWSVNEMREKLIKVTESIRRCPNVFFYPADSSRRTQAAFCGAVCRNRNACRSKPKCTLVVIPKTAFFENWAFLSKAVFTVRNAL